VVSKSKPKPIATVSSMITTGLVLNLDASNPASYPGTGTVWTNLVAGNAVRSFTLNAGVSYVSTDNGILRFSNSGWASTTSTLGRLAKYSIEVWVKLAGTTGAHPCLFSDMYTGSVNMILAYNNSSFGASNQFTTGYYNAGWNTYSTTSSSSDLNNWIHIVATYNGSICTIYKNGINIGSGSIGTNPATSNAGYYIGHRWDSDDLAYGDYAILNLYNQDISSSEVLINYNAIKSRFGL
jgi:hypothetical protein